LFKKQEKLSGYLLFLLSALITIIFFPKKITFLALVYGRGVAILAELFSGNYNNLTIAFLVV